MHISVYPWPLSHRITYHKKSPVRRLLKVEQKPTIEATIGAASITAIAKVISDLPRREVAALAECLIELLDLADGDADFEDSHDQEYIDEREPEDFY